MSSFPLLHLSIHWALGGLIKYMYVVHVQLYPSPFGLGPMCPMCIQRQTSLDGMSINYLPYWPTVEKDEFKFFFIIFVTVWHHSFFTFNHCTRVRYVSDQKMVDCMMLSDSDCRVTSIQYFSSAPVILLDSQISDKTMVGHGMLLVAIKLDPSRALITVRSSDPEQNRMTQCPARISDQVSNPIFGTGAW